MSHEIDEEGVQEAHSEVYEKGNAGSLDASALGSAAALQALKNFTSGGSSSTGGSSGGGNTQSKLIGLAMAEASKLFDSKGASGGNKQDAVNGAAETVLKLLLKSKFKSVVGGSDSGGLGGLAGLVSLNASPLTRLLLNRLSPFFRLSARLGNSYNLALDKPGCHKRSYEILYLYIINRFC